MSMDYRISCTKCGQTQKQETAFRCSKCNSILEVLYERFGSAKLRPAAKGKPLSRYIDFLPIKKLSATLGEGKTPLKRIRFDGPSGMELFLKLETDNPTKTFKDRGSAIEISKAVELQVGQVCCASTGNMGLSVARYAKHMGIGCTVFISRGANPRKMEKIRAHGARVVKVDGDFNSALNEAERFSRRSNAFVCGDYHFRKEGQKTAGFEIMEQLDRAPDYLFMPVGNATLFSGVYKGLIELRKAGLLGKRLPRMVAVQSEGCDPLIRACLEDRKIQYQRPRTEADAIAVGYPTFGFEGLAAIGGSHGGAVAVSEEEIEGAALALERFKVYAELGGATGYAGFLRYCGEHPDKMKGKRVVVVVTGNNEGVFKTRPA